MKIKTISFFKDLKELLEFLGKLSIRMWIIILATEALPRFIEGMSNYDQFFLAISTIFMFVELGIFITKQIIKWLR